MNPCFYLNHIREREVGRATPGGGGGGTPYNGQYGETPPERKGPFSGFRYIKGWRFRWLNYMKG